MNHTTPRLTVETIAPTAGDTTAAPQPLGTWFSRWHRLYTSTPATTEATSTSTASALPRTTQFTTAA